MAAISIRNLNKAYGKTRVLHDINLDIADNSFVVFVGPSGCGKSTLLRTIAGLEDKETRQILLDGRDISDEAPVDRDVAMVFQSYALYPQMTVAENIGFAAVGRQARQGDHRTQGPGGREPAAARRCYLERKPSGPLRRPAPARRHRPRHRARPKGLPVRRAAVQSRCRAACRDAPADRAAPPPPRRHLHLRHARPGRGDDARRYDRGSADGRDRAGRLAARASITSRPTSSSRASSARRR